MIATLKASFSEFRQQIEAFRHLLLELQETITPDHEDPKLTQKGKTLLNEISLFLSKAFDQPVNYFSLAFLASETGTVKGTENPVNMRIVLQTKLEALDYLLRLVSVCDHVKDKQAVNLQLRQRMSIQDMQYFLLEKLYDLLDEKIYPVGIILEGNGLAARHHTFFADLVKYLENKQLIETVSRKGHIYARLSLSGALSVEEIRSARRELQGEIAGIVENTPDVQRLKDHWIDLIKSDKLEEVARQMWLKIHRDSMQHHRLAGLSGQLYHQKGHHEKGTMSTEMLNIERNRTRQSLLLLIRSLEDIDVMMSGPS